MANDDNAAPGMVPRLRDPQYREIYTNSSNSNLGPFDISFTFQKISEVSPGVAGVVDLATVTFSPQHFKAFLRVAITTMQAYETSYGELSISDADTAPMRTAEQIIEEIGRKKAEVAKARK